MDFKDTIKEEFVRLVKQASSDIDTLIQRFNLHVYEYESDIGVKDRELKGCDIIDCIKDDPEHLLLHIYTDAEMKDAYEKRKQRKIKDLKISIDWMENKLNLMKKDYDTLTEGRTENA